MTYAEIKAEVRRRLAQYGGGVFFTAADIATAVQLGYAELSDETEWNESYVTIALENNRPFYDLRTMTDGATLLATGPAFSIDSNRWLLPVTMRELDTYDRRWEVATDAPFRFLTMGLWWLGYWPRVQSDIGTVKQYYTSLPSPFVDDYDEPGFPSAFHYGIVEWALTDLWAQDGETQRVIQSWGAYLDTEKALQAWVDQRAGAPMRRGSGSVDSLASYH